MVVHTSYFIRSEVSEVVLHMASRWQHWTAASMVPSCDVGCLQFGCIVYFILKGFLGPKVDQLRQLPRCVPKIILLFAYSLTYCFC